MGIKTEDTVTHEPEEYKKKHKEPEYQEGDCERCGNYAQLYEIDGRLLCEVCKDEEGKTDEADAQED